MPQAGCLQCHRLIEAFKVIEALGVVGLFNGYLQAMSTVGNTAYATPTGQD